MDVPEEFREMFHGNYRIIYHYDGCRVLIVAVINAAQLLDPESLNE